jgi:hypothetical protein
MEDLASQAAVRRSGGQTVGSVILSAAKSCSLFSVNPQTGAQEFESDSVRAGEIRIGPVSGLILPVIPAVD